MTLPLDVRDACEADMPYVVGTWRDAYAAHSTIWAFSRDVYFALMSKHINELHREPEASFRVAFDPQAPATLLGFAAMTGPELHFVYVRGGPAEVSLRKHGVARLLLEGRSIERYSFQTDAGLRRLKLEERGWKFTPRRRTWADGNIQVEMR